ncbi:PAS domain-containing protein [Candidatus Saccharibacteria bacterium]|nr:PAS domain-containing protein [Candidatus Saccharibacteria bacterium]
MALFGKKNEKKQQPVASSLSSVPTVAPTAQVADSASLAHIALSAIKDGVMIVDSQRLIRLINPAGIRLTGDIDVDLVVGMDAALSIQLEDDNGNKIADEQNPVLHAISTNQAFESTNLVLVSKDNGKKYPVEIFVIPTGGPESDRIVTIRDITKEKREEDAQSEFISTASHEMRTPVASIEGYLGLALNPQTATIDNRAKTYLEAAHNASQHLGKLFQDLLDVTKLDDRKIQPHFRPIVLPDYIKQITDNFVEKARAKNVQLIYDDPASSRMMRTIEQPIYVFVDIDFLNEIVSNLIDNAIKYTPSGKTIRVSTKNDKDRGVVVVQDAGIGITGADLQHIFQKFYRADNSQTREIGGTGLGLYIVKQRTEAMNGTVWAESVYGQGSTFFVSFPKLSQDEYEKRQIALANEMQLQKAQQMKQYQEATMAAQVNLGQAPQPATQQTPQSATPTPQPAIQQAPVAQPQYVQAAPTGTSQPAPQMPQQQAPVAQPAQPQPTAPPAQMPISPPNSTQNNQNIIQ